MKSTRVRGVLTLDAEGRIAPAYAIRDCMAVTILPPSSGRAWTLRSADRTAVASAPRMRDAIAIYAAIVATKAGQRAMHCTARFTPLSLWGRAFRIVRRAAVTHGGRHYVGFAAPWVSRGW